MNYLKLSGRTQGQGKSCRANSQDQNGSHTVSFKWLSPKAGMNDELPVILILRPGNINLSSDEKIFESRFLFTNHQKVHKSITHLVATCKCVQAHVPINNKISNFCTVIGNFWCQPGWLESVLRAHERNKVHRIMMHL
eukprot:g54212.t1